MRTFRWIIAGAVAAALAGCGADEISSAGSNGGITINNPPATTPNNPEPPPTSGVQPATACPDITNPIELIPAGTITGPTGTYLVCNMPERFTANTTLPRVPGLLYGLQGRIDVGADLGPSVVAGETPVTLTIEPGVVIFAQTGTSWLAVNRGNRIQAIGSPTRPIVFTSRENVLGTAGDTSQGQWGGVVLMGRAPITDCIASGATPGTTGCERNTEGSVDLARYGGDNPNDTSGAMSYVQIRYSGYILSLANELQALTLEGVGSGTKIDHIHSHNSSDDGFENFGGTVPMRYLVLTGADDDSMDLDVGYRSTIQYVIAVQKPSTSSADSMIELDSTNANEAQQPRTNMKVANFTFVHRSTASSNNAAMLFRGKADATLVNGVVTSGLACLRYTGAGILTADATIGKEGAPVFRSVALQCGAGPFLGTTNATAPAETVTADQVATTFGSGTNGNNSTFTTSLANTFVNGAAETGVTATDPKTIDAAFDTTNYIGAVRDANDTWYAGWTCNSNIANFGTTSSACSSLPDLSN